MIMRFGWIDPVYDVGMGVPERCDRCGEAVEPLEHPRFYAGRTTTMRGLQWTCACSTWGPVADEGGAS